jgi:hypothetical protein
VLAPIAVGKRQRQLCIDNSLLGPQPPHAWRFPWQHIMLRTMLQLLLLLLWLLLH